MEKNVYDNIFECFKKRNIDKIVYTKQVSNTLFIAEAKSQFDVIEINDARTATYVSTGLSAGEIKPIVLVCDAGIESRSIFPGLTEAFYRYLPVLVISIAYDTFLDYKKKIDDTVQYNEIINIKDEIADISYKLSNTLDNLCSLKQPIYLELRLNYPKSIDVISISNDLLTKLNNDNFYYYISNSFSLEFKKIRNYYYENSKCHDGCLSIFLGCSLSKKYQYYIGFFTDFEIQQDINTFGNKHFPKNVMLIIKKTSNLYEKIIKDYSKTMDFESYSLDKFDFKIGSNKPILLWI